MAEDKHIMEQLAAAHEEVVQALLGPIRESWREIMKDRPWEAVMAFVHAVDWKEPWIVALLAAQAALWLSAVLLRRSTAYLSAVFVGGAAVVFFGERLNALGAAHWRSFAGQPYFDGNGAFFAALVAGPLVLTLFTVLILYLLQVVGVMVEVKRHQVLHSRRQQQAGGGGGGSAAAPAVAESKKGR
ncbi:hypothetical protein Rsub_06953 [Raphidocelis subcapitata]|uniref:Uncharacterized protein n=1 Tax=Raphidocelis subcapitata TaxID=307507 RepID=A0A2V0P378_9CHLO|nr:hypothetical protein Rsub_06953 [Raphidocelis subcapitata]|eukprot:GBF94331.1 hypothetical protein Rsub_06953 [Raphidocelis subcapitata]